MTIDFVRLLGSLTLLIYGMKTMSDALQKLAGPSLRHILARMTGNRFSGMLTGTMVTFAVQSSSATTVMNVSFVSPGGWHRSTTGGTGSSAVQCVWCHLGTGGVLSIC